MLDVAEEIVRRGGATALTFENVAGAAGITKGGVQYCFGDKDGLVAAMIDRWVAAFDAEVERNSTAGGGTLDMTRGYVIASGRFDATTQAKMVGMLVTLLQTNKHLPNIRKWYAGWIGKFNTISELDRRARTAFFAAEGAFFVRSLGLIEMDQTAWEAIFDDILEIISSE
ncbi:TetR/AcrR family transcriptional regulator [Methylobacterium oryzae]|uniref:TetR/AcrR family transcriptional regulator n=1 Tax=Methylobacterium oryzae TaxID=334852 RepID=UPI002F35F077